MYIRCLYRSLLGYDNVQFGAGGDHHFENACCIYLQSTEATGSSETTVRVTIGMTMMRQTDYYSRR
jgi:hypothetical protein